MRLANEVSLSDTSVYDMNGVLSELFGEIDTLEELRLGEVKQEQQKHVTKANNVVIHAVMSAEYVINNVRKLTTSKRSKPSLNSMFQIY